MEIRSFCSENGKLGYNGYITTWKWIGLSAQFPLVNWQIANITTQIWMVSEFMLNIY